jgi:hypothetical protein
MVSNSVRDPPTVAHGDCQCTPVRIVTTSFASGQTQMAEIDQRRVIGMNGHCRINRG